MELWSCVLLRISVFLDKLYSHELETHQVPTLETPNMEHAEFSAWRVQLNSLSKEIFRMNE